MLIPISKIISKYKFIPSGILHVGACQMEEMDDYKTFGVDRVIWIEANPNLVEINESKAKTSGHQLIQGLIYDVDGAEFDFNLTNNLQSSSILDFDKHKHYHPQVEVINTIKLKTTTLKTLLESNDIPRGSFDFINLDIQGVELRALKGLGDYIEDLKFVYTEINTGQVYSNNDVLEDIDKYLESKDFTRVETEITPYEWGDAFYIKRSLS
jgi:FkbM family methyltransferase